MPNQDLIQKINRLKREKNSVILVHNYQRPEIYEIADFIGDSFGLSRQAAKTDADMIVFCGVDFMAESAYILNPGKKVIFPPITAKCPMAAMASVDKVVELKEQHPNAAVVSYVNTTADVKAESDICCTSANAVKVVQSLPNEDIIFVPDNNLASYVGRFVKDKRIYTLDTGFCYVHNRFSADGIKSAKEALPDAKVVVHPECRSEVIDLADHVCSTSGMVPYCRYSDAGEFIIVTEIGMIERLKIEVPGKRYYQAPPGGTCIQMKKNSLDKVYQAIVNETPVVTVPEDIRVRAKRALDRMLEVG